jgi:hypothetical protein
VIAPDERQEGVHGRDDLPAPGHQERGQRPLQGSPDDPGQAVDALPVLDREYVERWSDIEDRKRENERKRTDWRYRRPCTQPDAADGEWWKTRSFEAERAQVRGACGPHFFEL